jgi:hypothetical protein
LIDPDPFFNHDHECDENFSAGVYLKIVDQGPVEIILPVHDPPSTLKNIFEKSGPPTK